MPPERVVEPAWVIALTEPNRDFEVDIRLRKAGYRVVFLTYRHLLTGHNRPGWRASVNFVPRPLFGGYLFLRFWPNEPWPKPQQIAGYTGLLDDGRCSVHEKILAEWRNRVDRGEFDDKPPMPYERVGKFIPATDAEERRRLLREHFASALDRAEALFA